MFIFQTDGSPGKKTKKAIWGVTDYFIQLAPNSHLEYLSGGFGNSIKCMVHFLNGSGEDLPVEFTNKEWKFLITAANYSTSDIIRGKPSPAGTVELLERWEKSPIDERILFWSNPSIEAFKQELQRSGLPIKLTDADAKKISALREWESHPFTYDKKDYDVRYEFGGLKMSIKVNFAEWLKTKGYDLDEMKNEMKNSEIREILVQRDDGKPPIPYAIHKEEGNLKVFLNRTWVKCADGWERAYMIPGGLNSSKMKETTDAWSVLGYTTVARRQHPGGYEYKVEEMFDFSGSVYKMDNRSIFMSPALGKVIKTLYPELISPTSHIIPEKKGLPARGNEGKYVIRFNDVSEKGKPFKIISAPFFADKEGNPLTKEEVMAPKKQPAKVIR